MKTVSFKLSSGSIYCYNLNKVVRVRNDSYKRSSGLVKKYFYFDTTDDDTSFRLLYYQFKEEDGEQGRSYEPNPGEFEFYGERLDDCILIISKLLEVGFLDERGYNYFLSKFHDHLIHYYDGKTKKAERELEKREEEIKKIQESDIDNDELESQIEDLMQDMDLLSRISK